MPARRLPNSKAEISGAAIKNPQRHVGRAQPKAVNRLGARSTWLKGGALKAWKNFKAELPWLTESDRAIVEIAAQIRGRLIDGEEVGISALNQLRMALAQLGATPADRSKVSIPDEGDEDPDDEFFSGARH